MPCAKTQRWGLCGSETAKHSLQRFSWHIHATPVQGRFLGRGDTQSSNMWAQITLFLGGKAWGKQKTGLDFVAPGGHPRRWHGGTPKLSPALTWRNFYKAPRHRGLLMKHLFMTNFQFPDLTSICSPQSLAEQELRDLQSLSGLGTKRSIFSRELSEVVSKPANISFLAPGLNTDITIYCCSLEKESDF